MALLMECLHGGDAAVGQAATLALLDLLVSFGSAMLRHCENRTMPQYSCLLGLLLAASCGRTPAIRHYANEALRWAAGPAAAAPTCILSAVGAHPLLPYTADNADPACRHMAERLNQLKVIRLLEAYLDHPQAAVRSKAAEHLMRCTYRRPDDTTPPRSPARPASPVIKWRG